MTLDVARLLTASHAVRIMSAKAPICRRFTKEFPMTYTVRTAAESEATFIEESWGSLRWLASARAAPWGT